MPRYDRHTVRPTRSQRRRAWLAKLRKERAKQARLPRKADD